MKKDFRERDAMYDRHKPIIKWYEYDARKLYKTAEAEEVKPEADIAAPPQESVAAADVVQEPVEDTSASLTGDSAMDDEVARIMAQFSGAKQNNVDDVFAMMAAEVNGPDEPAAAPAEDDQDALLASLLKPKQSSVDDLVAKAREGN